MLPSFADTSRLHKRQIGRSEWIGLFSLFGSNPQNCHTLEVVLGFGTNFGVFDSVSIHDNLAAFNNHMH